MSKEQLRHTSRLTYKQFLQLQQLNIKYCEISISRGHRKTGRGGSSSAPAIFGSAMVNFMRPLGHGTLILRHQTSCLCEGIVSDEINT